MLSYTSILKLYPDNLITVIIMLSALLQCCIFIVMIIKLTVVVAVVHKRASGLYQAR